MVIQAAIRAYWLSPRQSKKYSRRPGDVAARIGGEEFSVLLPNTNASGASFMAILIRDAVRELAITHVRSPANMVTISIGVATVLPADDSTLAVLVRAADDALYEAKRTGGNEIKIASHRLLCLP